MTFLRAVLLSACLAAVSAGAAHAQIVIDKVQPGRLDEPKAGKDPTIIPEAPQSATKTSVASAQAMSGKIAGVRLERSSLPREAAEAAMAPFIGKPITPGTLQQLADAYSQAYARSDIALYSILIPGQTFADGLVRVTVIENYIDEVILGGENPETASLTSSYAAAMAEQRPLTRQTLERYLLLMNDVPGATTTPNVIAGERPDTVKLVLDTKRDPIETVVTLDTRGAAKLGRTQVQSDIYINGLGYEGNQTRLTAAASADFDRFVSTSLSHATTFGPTGLTAGASIGYFRTRPDDSPIEGQGYTASLQGSYPLIRGVNTNVTLAGGLDGFNSDNALVGQTLSSDRTRTLRGALSIENSRGQTAWGGSVSISQGIDGLGARVSNPALASSRFTKANLQLAATRALNPYWRIQGAFSTQLTTDRLPTSELMAIGGARFGRAFESGIASADSGVAGSLEIARKFGNPKQGGSSEAYAFVDGGKLWFSDRLGYVLRDAELSSAGGGVRLAVAKNTAIGIEAARQLRGRQDDGWRMSVSLGSNF